MKILVTGGAGFIGSHITEYLIKNTKASLIRVLDNLSTGNMDNIMHFLGNDRFEFIKGDITDLNVCRSANKDIDVICHQAALGSVPRSIDNPLNSHNSNVNGFFNILLSAKEHGIKRVVYASSSSVYGDDEHLPKVESTIGQQLSPYAVTKYIDELYGNIFTKTYCMEIIGLRYFNVFGPRQNPNGPYAAVIPKFIIKFLNGKAPTINGDGSYSRDFTFVSNVVNANIKALLTEREDAYGKVFNIAYGGRIAINDLVLSIKKFLDSDINPIYGPLRKGDMSHSNADITKAKEILEYLPDVDFVSGLNLTINYYKYILANVDTE